MWVVELLLLTILLCVPLATTMLAQPARLARFTIDDQPVLLPLVGFHLPERLPDTTQPFRWTQARSQLDLPNPGGQVALDLLMFGRPAEQTPLRLTAGTTLFAWEARPEPRRYHVLLPTSSRDRLTLIFDTPTREINRRDLGVAIGDLRVSGGAAPSGTPLVIAVVAIGTYLLLRQLAWGARTAGGLSVLAECAALLAYSAGGWRYLLFGSALLVLASIQLALVVLEIGWHWATSGPTSRAHVVLRGGAVALGVAACTSGLLWLAAPTALPTTMRAGLCVATVGIYVALRQAGMVAWQRAGIIILIGVGALIGFATLGSIAVLLGPALLLAGVVALVAARVQQRAAGPAIGYEAIIATVLLAVFLAIGAVLHTQVWGTEKTEQDIYYMWKDGNLIAAGENPYARILAGDLRNNEKYPIYFPAFFLFVALASRLGYQTFPDFLALWQPICLLFNLLVASVIYYAVARRGRYYLALFMAGLWLFNIWTIYVSEVAQIDFIAIFCVLLSIVLADSHKKTSLLLFSCSLAFKQVAIFLLPLYLIIIWKSAPKNAIRNLAVGGLIALSLPLLASLPFLLWSAPGYVRSMIFSLTRHPELQFQVSSLDHLIRQIFSDFAGTPAKIPMLLFMSLAYLCVWRGQVGLQAGAFLVIAAFVNFESVVYYQHMTWIMGLLPLLLCDDALYQSIAVKNRFISQHGGS